METPDEGVSKNARCPHSVRLALLVYAVCRHRRYGDTCVLSRQTCYLQHPCLLSAHASYSMRSINKNCIMLQAVPVDEGVLDTIPSRARYACRAETASLAPVVRSIPRMGQTRCPFHHVLRSIYLGSARSLVCMFCMTYNCITEGHSNQDPRWTQKPIYTPIFTRHIRS